MSALELPSQGIVMPGKGFVPLDVLQAQRAVKEYGEDLSLGRHEQTGDWVVLKRGLEGRDYPVFGLGRDLPSPEHIKKQLYEGDVVRNGQRIMAGIERQYQEARRRAEVDRAAQTEEVAEAFLWAARKDGKASIPRVFIPGEKGAKK